MENNISVYEALGSPYANVKTIFDLINLAVKLEDQMPVGNYITNQESKLNIQVVNSDNNNQFYNTNGVVVFFYENACYELPSSKRIIKILEDAGFERKQHWITFCNGQYPIEYKEYWKYLNGVSDIVNEVDAAKDIEEYKKELIDLCEKDGIKPLSPEFYERCFRVPDNGYDAISTISGNKINKSPRLFSDRIHELPSIVGKISKFIPGGGLSGIYTFVDIDGSVYVTESEEVIEELRKNGFKESELVKNCGLGWNEEFKDPFVQKKYKETVVKDEVYYQNKASKRVNADDVVEELIKARKELERLNEENRRLKEQASRMRPPM